jgi:hypothetical protein
LYITKCVLEREKEREKEIERENIWEKTERFIVAERQRKIEGYKR